MTMSLKKKTTSSGMVLGIILGLVFALALGVGPVFALHDDGIFQIDGDAKTTNPPPVIGPGQGACGGYENGPSSFGGTEGCTGEDWDTLYTCILDDTLGCVAAQPCDANGDGVQDVGCTDNHANAISALVVDLSPASIFTQGGSKDEKDITEWMWKNGNVPDKDDLIEAFASVYVAPATGGNVTQGDKLIYFGSNRLAVNGDAQIGFWFLQNPVVLGGNGNNASPFEDGSVGGSVSHKVGDVLILSNFTNGGGETNIQVYEVTAIGPINPCPAGSVETSAMAGDVCTALLLEGTAGENGVCNPGNGFPSDAACAATNGIAVDALDPDFIQKSGDDPGQYPIVGFFEGGLNLSAIGLGNECFPTFAVETRSSQSITAVLKDFTLGSFERCFASIATDIIENTGGTSVLNGTVMPTTVIHDEATVTGNAGGPNPGVGGDGNCDTGTRDCKVMFKFFDSNNCSGTPSTEEVNCLSNGDGTCTAKSSDFTTSVNTSRGYSYKANYKGDSNYPPIVDSMCEVVNVNKLNSNIETHIFLVEALTGGSGTTCSAMEVPCEITDSFIDLYTTTGGTTVKVRDQALVTPDSSQTGLPVPTGTVTFTMYSNADCTGSTTVNSPSIGTAGPLCDGTVTIPAAAGCAQSPEILLGATGLSYRAVYGGDSIYNGSETGRCEPVCAINSAIPDIPPVTP